MYYLPIILNSILVILDRIIHVIVFSTISVALLLLFVHLLLHFHHPLGVLLDYLLVPPPLNAEDDDDNDGNQGDSSPYSSHDDGVPRETVAVFFVISGRYCKIVQ